MDLVRCRRICAVRFSIHASHCCGERAKGPSAPPGVYPPGRAVESDAPCRGRCLQKVNWPNGPRETALGRRPAHCTIEHCVLGCRSPVRICLHAVANDTRYCRDDVDIVPYEHGRTAGVVRRAGPMCPAAGTHRKPHDRLVRSDPVGRGLAPAAGTFNDCFAAVRKSALGCPPSVGKSGRRGIFRQGKVWVRSHTGCMARNRTAAMAEKARRAPQTHGRWVAL